MDYINNRRSIRKYTNRPVDKDDIEQIIKAGSMAPSAKNRQPWKYIVYVSDERNKLLDVMESGLKKEQNEHLLLPNSSFGLPDAFHTLQIMRTAPVIIVIINTNGISPYKMVNSDERVTEICDTLSIGASVENILLKATELGLGTLWIANTCFAYNELMEWIGSEGQLVGAIALGYADEHPSARPRKQIKDILEYR